MSNVEHVIGNIPEKPKRITDMKPGEVGYTVPWAYSDENGLNTNFTINEEKDGTVSLWVECVADGRYVIEFETPIYRNIITGEME